tara:strand:- start:125 stop:967 length:843 start_codon:yes stop_codon:yes gene_type:complete
MITSIIFSKDRPLQLDLCLKSISKNFTNSSQNIVIYNNSPEFATAHKTLEKEHPNIEFWPQSDSLFKDILHAIRGAKNDYICFFTDDDICYMPFYCEDFGFLNDPLISCMSLRMGLNIIKRDCIVNGEVKDECNGYYQIAEHLIAWPKTRHFYGNYWAYDLSVDGHIFQKENIERMINELYYLQPINKWGNTPNVLESVLQRFWCDRSYICSTVHSVVVNSPNNRVQQTHNENKSGDEYDYTPQFLLSKYLSGQRIELESLDFSNIKCPHTEIDILKGLS